MTRIFFYIFCSFFISFSLLAEVVVFKKSESIKAVDVNKNFNHIKSIMEDKSIPVSFNFFSSNQVIQLSDFEIEFNKVRSLGIDVLSPLNFLVKSEELNTAFNQMILGVTNYDDIPLASDFTFEATEDVIFSGDLPVVNHTGNISIIIVSPPIHGEVATVNKSFTYTPDSNFFGNDEFYYRAFDGTSYSDDKKVTISVNPINDAPVVSSQNITAYESVSTSITLTATDIENSPLTYSIITSPTHGTISGSGANLFYTATSGYSGSDFFTIKANDGSLDSQTTTININVIPRIGIIKGASYRYYSDGSVATSCQQYQSNSDPKYIYSGNTGTGVYLIDPDGGSQSNSYSEYCNFNLAPANINLVKFQVASAGYGAGPTYIYLNDTYVSVSYGRGWTVVAYNKNLEQIGWGTYDPYGVGAGASNNLANFLNNLPNGSIIAVVTADEPSNNFNAAASTALSRYGCSVPGLAFRSAYSCVGMKTTTGSARLIGGSQYSGAATNNTYFINWKNSISPY